MNNFVIFEWFTVRDENGEVVPLRWARNTINIPGRVTFEDYIKEQRLEVIDGPFKTKKQACVTCEC